MKFSWDTTMTMYRLSCASWALCLSIFFLKYRIFEFRHRCGLFSYMLWLIHTDLSAAVFDMGYCNCVCTLSFFCLSLQPHIISLLFLSLSFLYLFRFHFILQYKNQAVIMYSNNVTKSHTIECCLYCSFIFDAYVFIFTM